MGKDCILIRELPAGCGFANVLFPPLPHSGKPALVVELKYDNADGTAVKSPSGPQ
ncbi:MAG: hypothetical protein K2I96_19750 [Lachnospiraceae bacterium]|nr:hypothetical protein [Lachnospiraceae bacterium]